YTVGAVLLLAVAVRKPSVNVFLLAGCFGGLAISFKLIGVIYVVSQAATAAALLLLGKQGFRDLSRKVLGCAAGLTIFVAPWLILRWFETGNPIFPPYNDLFRNDKKHPVNERFDQDQY